MNSDCLIPRHLGIIMDGNGRWAQQRGLPRTAGHVAGVKKATEIIQICGDLGIVALSLYAFSTENWSRPAEEVAQLMRLCEQFAREELPVMQRNGVRFRLIGRREGLPASLLEATDQAARLTRHNSRMMVNLAINYGGKAEIIDAIKSMMQLTPTGEQVDERRVAEHLYSPDYPEADLVIRAGGEWRMSNFLLWQAANAVFWSTPVLWPDFTVTQIEEAIEVYGKQISN